MTTQTGPRTRPKTPWSVTNAEYNYDYADQDPVNGYDLSGMCSLAGCLSEWGNDLLKAENGPSRPVVHPTLAAARKLAKLFSRGTNGAQTFTKGCWNAVNPLGGDPYAIGADIAKGALAKKAVIKKGLKKALKVSAEDFAKDYPFVSIFTCAGGGVDQLIFGRTVPLG